MFHLDLCATISRLTQERDLAQQDATDLREGMDDLQEMYDDEKSKLLDKLKKELSAKDRQIESLEEQLRNATRTEIKKLKRGTTALCARHVPPFVFYSLITNMSLEQFKAFGLFSYVINTNSLAYVTLSDIEKIDCS